MQRIRVAGKRAEAVIAVGREARGCIPAHERRHGVQARRRQVHKQLPKRMGRVRESVQAQGQRTAARLEDLKVDAVGDHAPLGQRGHALTGTGRTSGRCCLFDEEAGLADGMSAIVPGTYCCCRSDMASSRRLRTITLANARASSEVGLPSNDDLAVHVATPFAGSALPPRRRSTVGMMTSSPHTPTLRRGSATTWSAGLQATARRRSAASSSSTARRASRCSSWS